MIELTDTQVRSMERRLARIELSFKGDTRAINQVRAIRLEIARAQRRQRRKMEYTNNSKE